MACKGGALRVIITTVDWRGENLFVIIVEVLCKTASRLWRWGCNICTYQCQRLIGDAI